MVYPKSMKTIKDALLLVLALILFAGCGDEGQEYDLDGNPAQGIEAPTYTLQDGYAFDGGKIRIQVEGILEKNLGLTHYDQIIHVGHMGLSCVVDVTVSSIIPDENQYHLRIQDTVNSMSNDPRCSDAYGIYWIFLTSNSEARLEQL